MPDTPHHLIADRYRLLEPLGQGGMGRVWKARDEMLNRDVAIKELVFPPGLTDELRRELRERSLREARSIARLNQSNVVRVFDVIRVDAKPWIVMELVPSRSLHQVLATEGPMRPERVAEIGLGVLAALQAAHRAGVLHRDVKPANVLLGANNHVVLTDFGLAIGSDDPAVTRTGMVVGSPAYLAPERATGGAVGPEADLWSLGATLYAAVEGKPPYDRSSSIATLAALATEDPPKSKQAGPLAAVLDGLLRREPSERLSMAETERLLHRTAGTATTATPASDASSPGLAANASSPASDPVGVSGDTHPSGGGGKAPVFTTTRRWWLAGVVVAFVVSVLLVRADVFGISDAGSAVAVPGSSPSVMRDAPLAADAQPMADWRDYLDNTGFRVLVPSTWLVHREGQRVEFRSQSGGDTLTVSQSRAPESDLVAAWKSAEKSRPDTERYRDYHRVRIAAVDYYLRAADWEWTYTGENGERMHAIERRFATSADQAYDILWSVPDATWDENQTAFRLIKESFRPAGTARTTPGPSASPTRPVGSGQGPTPMPTVAARAPSERPTPSSPEPARPQPVPGAEVHWFGNNKCLTAPSEAAGGDVSVSIWSCNGSAGQKWTFAADGTARALGKCLTADGGRSENGTRIRLTTCSGAASQQFVLKKSYDLVYVTADRCVDVIDGGTANGTHLQLWQCNGGINQKWRR
ncbi:protein kinase [Micromonospora sp. NPDC005367]|uniref:protein kinase domain-containing protein n=1 Tax=Micromonospora sp. NPDC005367 TaxID=3155590 RepID=UPI0033ABC394